MLKRFFDWLQSVYFPYRSQFNRRPFDFKDKSYLRKDKNDNQNKDE